MFLHRFYVLVFTAFEFEDLQQQRQQYQLQHPAKTTTNVLLQDIDSLTGCGV